MLGNSLLKSVSLSKHNGVGISDVVDLKFVISLQYANIASLV